MLPTLHIVVKVVSFPRSNIVKQICSDRSSKHSSGKVRGISQSEDIKKGYLLDNNKVERT